MIKSLVALFSAAGVILSSGCQIALPHHRFEELAIEVKGDEDGLFKARLINQLAFAGYRISESSRLHLRIESIETEDRNMGFQTKGKSKKKEIRASEADLTHSARVTLTHVGEKSQILGRKKIRAWTCFDFASDRLNQKQLSYSRGALTIRSEARKFALEELRDQLARKIVGWAELVLQAGSVQTLNSKAAFPQSGAEQIIFPNIDQNAFQDL